MGLHRRQDLRSDGIVPHVVEWHVEDAMGSLGGDLEGVGLELICSVMAELICGSQAEIWESE